MITVCVYGASDDNVEVEGCPGGDEFLVYDKPWRADLVSAEGRMRLHVQFLEDGWMVGVSLATEDDFPAWPVRIGRYSDGDNSPLMEIEAPDDVRLADVRPVPN